LLTGIFSILFFLILPIEKVSAKGAICLYDSTDVQVNNNLTAQVIIHKSFLITSEAGLRYAQVAVPINDFVRVQDVNGYTELPGGRKIRLNKGDIGTASVPGLGLPGGMQIVIFSLRTPTIGSRLYYEYKLIIKSLLYLPRITRQTDYPTNRLAACLRWGKKVELHYQFENVEEQVSKRKIHFSANNLAEIPFEPYSCPDNLHISISADRFNYGKRKYISESWQDVGRFFDNLSRQVDNTAPGLQALLERLNSASYTRDDSLSAFFNFLADSVTYVALQMGRGDFTPQSCSVVLNRRFGDCKDQSVLLTSLCRLAGLDAYPALISTADYPDISGLHPWPAWFDHVITVVKGNNGEILLDPSDPLATINSIPPRLRNKSYLICDGVSGLKTTPERSDPASSIFWEFHLSRSLDKILNVDFSLKYANDAATYYTNLWKGDVEQIKSSFRSQLKYSGWNMTSLDIGGVKFIPDSLIILGSFGVDISELGDSRSLAIASPVTGYLFDNFFPDVRQNDFCRDGSIRLEEEITVDLDIPDILPMGLYKDSFERQNFSFSDEMSLNHARATYHRIFISGGEILKAENFNSFRDFLLSRKNQQYVRFQK
jgi:hypothetical protein